MLTMTALYVFIVILAASILQTVSGFGFALAAAPLLALFLPPKEAVIVVIAMGILIKGFMVCKTWHEGSFARMLIASVASVIGAVPGSYALRAVSDSALKIAIGLTLVLVTCAMYFNYTVAVRRHGLAKALVGFLSGFLGAVTSFNGPPLVIYMMNAGQDKITIRADLARYFLLCNVATIIIAYHVGTVYTERLPLYAAVSVPAILLGWWLGQKAFHRVGAAFFRRMALTIIGFSGIVTVLSGILGGR
jgi:uncharacterized membrane protein YfcA